MRDLQKIYEKCLAEANSLNIPFDYMERIEWAVLIDSWGNCHREWEDNRFVYYISISDEYKSEKISIKELESTICHEIIHTCNGCLGMGKDGLSMH